MIKNIFPRLFSNTFCVLCELGHRKVPFGFSEQVRKTPWAFAAQSSHNIGYPCSKVNQKYGCNFEATVTFHQPNFLFFNFVLKIAFAVELVAWSCHVRAAECHIEHWQTKQNISNPNREELPKNSSASCSGTLKRFGKELDFLWLNQRNQITPFFICNFNFFALQCILLIFHMFVFSLKSAVKQKCLIQERKKEQNPFRT